MIACVRTRKIIAITALFIILLAIFHELVPHPPQYHGKSLSYWLSLIDDRERNDDLTWEPWQYRGELSSSNSQAAEAIRQMGTNSLPYLIAALSRRDPALKLKIIGLLNKQSWVAFHIPLASEEQRAAALALHVLGPMAKPVIPQLKKILDETKTFDPGKQVALALAGIGPEGWIVLTQAATNSYLWEADCAIWALGSHRAAVAGTVPALLRNLTNTLSQTGPLAAWALGEIGANHEQVVPVLMIALNFPAVDVRWSAAEALGKFGTNALAAVPALLHALQDTDAQVRNNSKDALKKIDPEAAAKAGVK